MGEWDWDRNRLKGFRQLKRQIRGSAEHLVVGIDVAKDRHHAFLGTAAGRTLFKRLVFGNNQEGFQELLNQVERLRREHDLREVVFGMEPTGNYHKPLGEYLKLRYGHVVLVSGVAVAENRKSVDGRWDKNDSKDGANIADLVSRGRFLFYESPDPVLQEVRDLLALKRRLKRLEHGYRVRIRNHLVAKYFPELDRYFDQSEKYSLAVVRWCLDPRSLSGREFEEFAGMVAPGKRGAQQSERLRTILQMARGSVGCPVGEAAEFEARMMVEGLREIRQQIGDTEWQIEERCHKFPEYSFLLSIPGFGPDISSKVLGAIGDPLRFENERQVLKMAGLDLNAERSGKRSDSARTVISKMGKADLRYALYQAAFIASTKNQSFIVYYTDKLRGREREPGIKTKMRVKLAAKLLVIAWVLMKKREAFNPVYLTQE